MRHHVVHLPGDPGALLQPGPAGALPGLLGQQVQLGLQAVRAVLQRLDQPPPRPDVEAGHHRGHGRAAWPPAAPAPAGPRTAAARSSNRRGRPSRAGSPRRSRRRRARRAPPPDGGARATPRSRPACTAPPAAAPCRAPRASRSAPPPPARRASAAWTTRLAPTIAPNSAIPSSAARWRWIRPPMYVTELAAHSSAATAASPASRRALRRLGHHKNDDRPRARSPGDLLMPHRLRRAPAPAPPGRGRTRPATAFPTPGPAPPPTAPGQSPGHSPRTSRQPPPRPQVVQTTYGPGAWLSAIRPLRGQRTSRHLCWSRRTARSARVTPATHGTPL